LTLENYRSLSKSIGSFDFVKNNSPPNNKVPVRADPPKGICSTTNSGLGANSTDWIWTNALGD